MKIYIASDHAGFKLKEKLKKLLEKKKQSFQDLGPEKKVFSDDYPDYALKVCSQVKNTKNKGILICGSGHGVNITANKVLGIYATICWSKASIKNLHQNINVICLPARLIKSKEAEKIISIWLKKKPIKEKRHIRRFKKIKQIEKRFIK